MKKTTLLLAFMFGFIAYSQSNRQLIQSYLETNKAKFQLTAKDIGDWVIESEVPGSGTGITSTFIVQRHQGIEIFNAQNNIWVKEGKIIGMPDNNFKVNIASKVNTVNPSISVLESIKSVYTKIGYTKPVVFTVVETVNNNFFKLSDGLSFDVISAKLVYQNTKNDKLRLAWAFQFYSPTNGDLLDLRIDAQNGIVLEENNLTISCKFGDHDHAVQNNKAPFSFEKNILKSDFDTSTTAPGVPGQYRVIPYNYTSPDHSPFQLITTTGNALASPNGWHNTNNLADTNPAFRFTYTRGNNVWAKEDGIGDNETSTGPNIDGTASLTFDFPYTNESAQPNTYLNASATNLFYMNNIMHDVWYQYGFTEASGNFQKDNYGRAIGVPGVSNSSVGDYVFADAQDGYLKATQDLNNANFATPNDGGRPRMQMFMWNSGAPPVPYLTVNSPSGIAGIVPSRDNSFEGPDSVAIPVSPGITSDVVLYQNVPVNPGQNSNSACQAPTNPLDVSGKIVLIRRGGCTFRDKVFAAQNAGAIAAIVMDSVPQSATYTQILGMLGTGVIGINIPAVSITKDAGEILVAELANGPVSVTLQDPGNSYLYADGSFDNTIIAHEYGHGISNKLIGGPANSSCMTNFESMGEGWSDWFGLMMQLKAGDIGSSPVSVGTFVQNEPLNGPGIRQYPYSTDLAINPLTFNGSNNPDTSNNGYRYTIGEYWATVLWDLNWAYINKYGFDPDIYNGTGGNNKVMRLILDALKLQACNTASLTSGRDKIFAAEMATTAGADFDMIAEVFRRRGMGLNASSGDPNLSGDQTEDFTPFPSLASTSFNLNSAVRLYPNPVNNNLNIRVGGFVGALNVQIVDVNGRVIFEQNDTTFNNEKSIDINSLRTGIYIVKLKADNLYYSEKLIKN